MGGGPFAFAPLGRAGYDGGMNSGNDSGVTLPYPWRETADLDVMAWAEAFGSMRRGGPSVREALWDPVWSDDASGGVVVGLENEDSGMRVVLNLVPADVADDGRDCPAVMLEYRAADVVVSSPGRDVRGVDLRDVPLAAICSAYSARDAALRIRLNRERLLAMPEPSGIPARYWEGGDGLDAVLPPTHILDGPLPVEYVRAEWFFALVAAQYDAAAEAWPGLSPSRALYRLNPDASPATVRRWLSKARHMGLLAPAEWTRTKQQGR